MIDLLDLVRSIAAAAERAAENKHYPAPFSQGSPLLASVRQACVERGYTSGGLAMLAAAPAAPIAQGDAKELTDAQLTVAFQGVYLRDYQNDSPGYEIAIGRAAIAASKAAGSAP